MDSILETVHLARESTFTRFYRRDSDGPDFAGTVLAGVYWNILCFKVTQSRSWKIVMQCSLLYFISDDTTITATHTLEAAEDGNISTTAAKPPVAPATSTVSQWSVLMMVNESLESEAVELKYQKRRRKGGGGHFSP